MEKLEHCPICNSIRQTPFLTCVDHTVSRETFTIVNCDSCGFKFTNPRPAADELEKYYDSPEYISHSNSKKGFINSAYQVIRKYTLLKKLQLISKYFKTGRILDIGCGTGEFLNTMNQAKWQTIGIEPSEKTRSSAIREFGLKVFPESHIDNFPVNSFEVITLWHVLEHVPDLNKRVEDIRRLLTDNGIAIVAVPNCASLDARIYGKDWAAYDVPRHLYHFTPTDIKAMFEKHSMNVTTVLPMVFDSIYISMLSEKIKLGKIRLFRSTWNGIRSNLAAIRSGQKYSSQIYIIRKK